MGRDPVVPVQVPVERAGRINLVFVSTGLSLGGAEKMLYRLATRFDRSKFRIGVVSLSDKGKVGEWLEAAGIRVEALNLQPGKIPAWGTARLIRVLESFDADLLQGWMYHGNLAVSLAAPLLRYRPDIVWGVRQSLYDLKKERPLTRAVIWTCAKVSRQPAAIIYNSNVSRAQHESRGFSSTSSLVIPNGFDLPHVAPPKSLVRTALGLPVDRTLVGLVARYHPIKDHALFLRAAALVAKRHPQAFFVFAGHAVDAQNSKLTRLIASLGLADRVRLLGEIEHASELIGALDLLCSASRGEAFPNVVAEAMAAAVPVVVTDIGDSAEIVGEAGHIVPPRDARSLAEAIAELIARGPAARAALGAVARHRVADRYRLQDVVRRYEQVYEEVIGRVWHRRTLQASCGFTR